MKNFIDVVKQMQSSLSLVGYEAGRKLAAEIALLDASRVDPGGVSAMVLKGAPGTGKTSLAKAMARVLGVSYYYIQAHQGTGPDNLLFDTNIVKILQGVGGDSNAVKSAEDVIQLGFIPTVFRESQDKIVVCFIDELDKALPATDGLLLSALQEDEVIVPGIGAITAKKENLIFFITMNDEREISEALMRRLRREYLDYPSEEVEMKILTTPYKRPTPLETPLEIEKQMIPCLPSLVSRVLIAISHQIRKLAVNDEVIKAPVPDELLLAGRDAIRLHKWRADDLIGPVVFDWIAAFEEDRKVIEERIITPQQLGEKIRMALVADNV